MNKASEKIEFIDLFGGIGGFRHGLEQSSDRYECVDYIEYDKYAVKSYNEIFGEQHEPRDVTKLSKQQIPEHDLLCAGFPCQSFSVAGNRQGTDEARGKLFREIVRIAEAHKPSMLLLENVKGILSQKAVRDGESVEGTKGHAFTEVLQALHELGYCLEWQVLNSKNWGVPQNRERVFIIGHLGKEPGRKVFPIRREDRGDTTKNGREREIKNVGNVNPSGRGMNGKVYKLDESAAIPTVSTNKGEGHKILNHQFCPESRPRIHGIAVWDDYNSNMREDGNTGTLTKNFGADATRNGNKIVQIPRGENDGGKHLTCPTLSSSSWHENNYLENEKRIRKLTPKECWRLQGFPDQAFQAAEKVNSDTQLYKQAGNAVTVNVIKALGQEIQEYF